MRYTLITLIFIIILCIGLQGQSNDYLKQKNDKIEQGSIFTKIINRKLPATIAYEDSEIIAFVPLRLQAPIHLLIVPKREIYTLNDASENDALLLGKMLLVAQKLAVEKGISESGYRISINTNEDSGQSVFHIHMHLLGGKPLGPMITQE